MLESVQPTLKTDQVYRGATVIEDDRIVVWTSEDVLLFNVDMELLTHVKAKTIHFDIKQVYTY